MSPERGAEESRIDFVFWLRRVIVWDGLLPVVVLALPYAIASALPNHPGMIEIASAALPGAAFFIRYCSGKNHIAANDCSLPFRRLQFCVFCVGLFPLSLIECVLVLSHIMPQGALFAADSDRMIFAALATVYLAAMFIAMYPGRTPCSRATNLTVLTKLSS